MKPIFDLVEELRWRGMIHSITPGAEELLRQQRITSYWGIDPSAASPHIGNLAAGMLSLHLQRAGHRPIILVGGATGLIGDPSGKNAERDLLTVEKVQANVEGLKKHLSKLFDFDDPQNGALMVNNYDFYKDMSVFAFLRDIGKHFSVPNMLTKDSVKNRLETGISFTEFSYQLIQGYDFAYLYKQHNCRLQLGGSDQWGNIVSGTELVRRMYGGEAHALTCPLLTKADGSKFGKSEGGNVWLDAALTSPYKFYQFWINADDEESKKLIRIFTFLSQEEILSLEAQHAEAPHLRILQKRTAEEVTKLIHGEKTLQQAILTSNILFGNATTETLQQLSDTEIMEVFEGVPTFKLPRPAAGVLLPVVDFLADHTGLLSSRGEARRALQENSVSINLKKIDSEYQISENDFLKNRYILVQRGRKNKFLVIVEG